MQGKDITEKMLEKYNDVFADILNVLLFAGGDVVDESALTDALPMSMLKIDGRVRTQERDIAKYWRKNKINVALFGLENQTVPNKLMPLRVFGYDGAEYVKQSRKENSDRAKYPVITLVLYLGYEKRWNYPKRLFDVLDIDEDIRPYVNDFKINLFEIAYLEREKVDLFKSDFRILADYLYQMRKSRDYIADETNIAHVEELLTLMSAMTGDNRFEETINDLKGKEKVNMCEVLDRVEARGIEKGRLEGRQEGTINTLISLVKDGILSLDEAAIRADMSAKDFKKYIK
ncbi:transposase [Lachnoanaerobaculum gingivalis]|uniref:Transposase n=1 Tax=Lachnoanaerobaculum gingivalis TaxID=2490855 RepID=A0A3P3QT19_9FIRM|nr:Rpn family recombination-promoting nuclease/putative transposase [Lachnoanaerobaculum gingivalis]RRJ24235.1 transposase [Lachnoanaerobaculum gingivalis]WHE87475.1 Rpn family recombination-promoting nuclease/putative transposase [Lachnoanaerobaculum gingivalis]